MVYENTNKSMFILNNTGGKMDKSVYSCKRALVSVADKTGLVEFLTPLVKKGLAIISTGGTAKHLEENGISVMDVESQTGFPEVMDGRVKTLHPKIHMCLLARDHVEADQNTLKDYNLEPFDLVIGNLYAFEQALNQGVKDKELAEFIDIGGPSLLRASAKSYDRITVICNPSDYSKILEKENLSLTDRKKTGRSSF